MGISLLDALYRYLPEGGFAILPNKPESLNSFFRDADTRGAKGASVPVLSTDNLYGLGTAGTVLMPIPNLDDLAYPRRTMDETAFSIVGITHTLSTSRIYNLLFSLLFAPVQSWDALICTSNAAKGAVNDIVESHLDYIQSRGSTVMAPPIQLPVIPLGIHCDRFERTAERVSKAQSWRQSMGIEDDDVVLLCFGRIDPLTKSHPLPMAMAIETAQRNIGNTKQLHLVIAGKPLSPAIGEDLMSLLKDYSPSFKIHWVDGLEEEGDRLIEVDTSHLWAAADIFISLSDNIQETFGLTPVEAMAASLPCIVSDWSGYRETVIDMQTGILVPTYLPHHESRLGIHYGDLNDQYLESYPEYVGGLAQATSVDIGVCANGIEYLVKNPDERHHMGENARRRAREVFDWSVVLSQYHELFDELSVQRETGYAIGHCERARQCANPFNPDPLKVFKGFSDGVVDRNTKLYPLKTNNVDIDWLLNHQGTSFASGAQLEYQQINAVLDNIVSYEGLTIGELCDTYKEFEESRIFATCLWLSKFGLLRLSPESKN